MYVQHILTYFCVPSPLILLTKMKPDITAQHVYQKTIFNEICEVKVKANLK